MKYFTKPGAKFPNGVINFDLFKTRLLQSKDSKTQFAIELEGQTRQFEFKCESAEMA